MKFFRLFLFSFFLLFPVHSAFAVEDFIAPTKISFTVQPGETFSYDIKYKSGVGGAYDFSTRPFQYNAQGNKEYLANASDLATSPEMVYTFVAGEEKNIPVHVVIPEGMEDQDVYLSHFLRRRTEEQQTFELGSLMFLRVGAFPASKGEVSNVQFHRREASEEPASKAGFYSITFDFQNTSERYFAVTPVVKFLDPEGAVLQNLESQSTYVFPEFVKPVNVFNFSHQDVSFSYPQTKAILVVLGEDRSVLHEQVLSLSEDDVFLAQERKESPFNAINVRRGILYHPIFQISAIVIGLTLIGFSLCMKKK